MEGERRGGRRYFNFFADGLRNHIFVKLVFNESGASENDTFDNLEVKMPQNRLNDSLNGKRKDMIRRETLKSKVKSAEEGTDG